MASWTGLGRTQPAAEQEGATLADVLELFRSARRWGVFFETAVRYRLYWLKWLWRTGRLTEDAAPVEAGDESGRS